MKLFIVLTLLVATALVRAATPVNIQSCAVAPSSSVGLMGCPTTSVKFAPVSPTTLVRSAVNGIQGWRAFNTLQPADLVVPQTDGQFHALSTVSVATTAPVTPVTPTPPATPTTPATCQTTSSAVTWTCTVTASTQTCTAPVSP